MLGVDVPDKLLKQFKSKTVLRGTTMKKAIRKLMTEYVENNNG